MGKSGKNFMGDYYFKADDQQHQTRSETTSEPLYDKDWDTS